MKERKRLAIGGINGRLGKATARLLADSSDYEIAGVFGRQGASYEGAELSELISAAANGLKVSPNLASILEKQPLDLVFENSEAKNTVAIAKYCIEHGIRFVSGSSGISDQDVAELAELAARKKTGALLIPNFSIGAVLMMEFARQAGSYFENVELVEMHHTKKLDAPSGTAMHTVKKLAASRQQYNKKEIDEHELLKGSRGAEGAAGVRVHSLRLPGLISHQEVIFGGPGELLTVRHDSFNMDCFLQGILLSLSYVFKIDNLQVGLDKVLGLAGQEKETAVCC